MRPVARLSEYQELATLVASEVFLRVKKNRQIYSKYIVQISILYINILTHHVTNVSGRKDFLKLKCRTLISIGGKGISNNCFKGAYGG